MHYIVSRHQAVDDDMQLIAVFERSAGELLSWWQVWPDDPRNRTSRSRSTKPLTSDMQGQSLIALMGGLVQPIDVGDY